MRITAMNHDESFIMYMNHLSYIYDANHSNESFMIQIVGRIFLLRLLPILFETNNH